MFIERMRALEAEISVGRLKRMTAKLREIEGDCSASRCLASAKWCEERLREAGAEGTEHRTLPCDGVTAFADCVLPQVWEQTGRSFLRIAGEERLLVDSEREPRAVPPWSAPTEEDGIVAELTSDPADSAGKWLLTTGAVPEIMERAAAAGAVGMVLDNVRVPSPSGFRAVKWENGTGRTGWYPVKGDALLPLFSISPADGQELRARLRRGEVTLCGTLRREIRDGEIRTVTGLLPGEEPSEIILCAHLYEPFGSDNAVSAAILLELCRLLRNASEKRRHSIRFLFGMERYGFAEYFSSPVRASRARFLFNLDCGCNIATGEYPEIRVFTSAPATPCFTDRILPEFAREAFGPEKVSTTFGTLSGDTFCSDLEPGISSFLAESADLRYQHVTCPEFEAVDWNLARRSASFHGAAALWLCSGDDRERNRVLLRIAESAGEEIDAALRTATLGSADLRLLERHLAGQGVKTLCSAEGFQIPPAEIHPVISRLKIRSELPPVDGVSIFPEPEASLTVLRRRAIPLMSLAEIPRAARRPPPADVVDFRLIYSLCDGRRNLRTVLLAARHLSGHTPDADERSRLYEYLAYLSGYGYLSLLPPSLHPAG